MDGYGDKFHVRKTRGRWQAVVSVFDYAGSGGGDGAIPAKRWRTVTKMLDVKSYPSGNAGKKTAERMAREWLESLRGREDERTRKRLATFGEYVERAITAKEASGNISPRTSDCYRWGLKYINGGDFRGRHIDGIGHIRLDSLTQEDVQGWVNQMAEAGYAPSTIRKAHALIKYVTLKPLVWAGTIPRNPAEFVQVPSIRKPDPNYLKPEQVGELLRALDGWESRRHAVAVELALFAGLRQGEACGLRWRDVDIERRRIKVAGVIARKGDGFFVRDYPKSASSVRIVPLGGPLLRGLCELRKAARDECAAAGVPFDGGLFVCGTVDRAYLAPHVLWQAYRRLIKRVGIIGTNGKPPTYHDLRHTWATLSVHAGNSIKSVSSLLGHSDPAITCRYYVGEDEDENAKTMFRTVEYMLPQSKPAEIIEMKGTGTYGR